MEMKTEADSEEEWEDKPLPLLASDTTADKAAFTWTNDEGVQVTLKASAVVIKKVILDLTVLAVFKSMETNVEASLTKYLLNLGKELTPEEMSYTVKNATQMKTKTPAPTLASFIGPLLERKDGFSQVIADNVEALQDVTRLMGELQKFKKEGWNNACGSFGCSVFKELWAKESNSASYAVRDLAGSFMFNKGAVPVIQLDDQLTVSVQGQETTTIMGLGPSGCGKSYYAKLLFPKFEKVTTVVAIDGGISRSMSVVWLATSVLKPDRVFISDIASTFSGISKSKQRLFQLLKAQNVPVSLYVPDTLMSALVSSYNPLNPIDSYIAKYNYTNGDAVSMLIMQHCASCADPKPCPFEGKYTCKGCDASGRSRETTEGKKYSSDQYPRSIELGYKYTEKATKCVFIHNSGRREGTSIIACRAGTFQNTAPLPATFFLEMEFPPTFREMERKLVEVTQQTIQTPAGFVNKKKLRAFFEGMKHKGGRTRRKKLYS